MVAQIITIALMILGIIVFYSKEKKGWRPSSHWWIGEFFMWAMIASSILYILMEKLQVDNFFIVFLVGAVSLFVVLSLRMFMRRVLNLEQRPAGMT